jgi:antitoxin ParD1/3/4
MIVNLGTAFDSFIADLLKTGLYQSPSEVVREGLLLLKEREELKQLRLAELRKEIAIGAAQADRGEFVDGKKRLLKSAAAAPRGSAPTDEAVRPHAAREAGCQRNMGLENAMAALGTKPLQVIRVLHAARNLQSILGLAQDGRSA